MKNNYSIPGTSWNFGSLMGVYGSMYLWIDWWITCVIHEFVDPFTLLNSFLVPSSICQWQLIDFSMNDASHKQFRPMFNEGRALQDFRFTFSGTSNIVEIPGHFQRLQRAESVQMYANVVSSIWKHQTKPLNKQWLGLAKFFFCTNRSFFRESWHYPANPSPAHELYHVPSAIRKHANKITFHNHTKPAKDIISWYYYT